MFDIAKLPVSFPFIFDGFHYSSAAATPVKYECDLQWVMLDKIDNDV